MSGVLNMNAPTARQMRRAVIRLRELEAGAEPKSLRVGICNDLEEKCEFSYDNSAWTFNKMGLNESYPIGRYGAHPWEGETGRKRREFAGKMADFLESLVKEQM